MGAASHMLPAAEKTSFLPKGESVPIRKNTEPKNRFLTDFAKPACK